MTSDGIWMDEVLTAASLDVADAFGKPICEPCEGYGKVAVPSLSYPSSFGKIRTVPKVVVCPVCHGSGRR